MSCNRALLPWCIAATLLVTHAPGASGTTVHDDVLTDGADGAAATRNMTFGPTGAIFDSFSDAIDYSDALIPAEGTIELVLRWDGSSQAFVLDTRGVGGRAPGDAAMFFRPSTGFLFFTIDPSGGNNPCCIPGVTSTTAFDAQTFHCVAVSYGSQGLKLYVDGVLEDANPAVTAPLIRSTITLGDFLDGAPQSWLGVIYRIRTSDVQSDVAIPQQVGCPYGDPTPAKEATWGRLKTVYR